MRILLLLGTRPEAVKLSPLIHMLKRKYDARITLRICVTAQHREMLDQVLKFFGIKPDYDLDLMQRDQSLNELSGKLFSAIDRVYSDFKPCVVFVQGDTTTSAICAWAAFHRRIRVAHVEAGLRTFDKFSPFPEELNRQITGRIADWHFAPTERARTNLLREGVVPEQIEVTGNTVIDALHLGLSILDNGYTDPEIESLKKLLEPQKRVILVTGHRRENFGQGFEQICKALKQIASDHRDVDIVYPVHLNPNVQKTVHDFLSWVSNIHLIPPLGYPAFLWLMRQAFIILTDSGGVQEEAPALGIPVLVMRNTTERPEAVEAGVAKLVGTDMNSIVAEASRLLHDPSYYAQMSRAINPYGDGTACERILNFIKTKLA